MVSETGIRFPFEDYTAMAIMATSKKRNCSPVIPAEAGIHSSQVLDSRLRGSDETMKAE